MAEKVASLYAEIGADTSKLDHALAQSKVSVKDMESSLHKLDLAAYEATQAAHKLAEAEHQLAVNTDPTKQDELRGAVLKARVEADRAQATVDKYGKELDGLNATTTTASTKQATLSDSFKSFVKIGASVTAAIYSIKKGYDETIDKAIKYNKAMLEGSQVTGMQVEAFSRLVQVGDDVEVSSETITTALAMMRQKGLQPSIEAIADLADEYVASGNTSEFAEKAVERLGRGWKELAPLLSMGGDALKEATAAVNDNLIATEAEIKRTEELRLAIDTAKDAWDGFAMEVGGKVAPLISYTLTPAIKKVIDGQEYWVRVIGDTTFALKEGGRGLIDATSEYLAAEAATIKYTWAKKDELAITEEVTAATEAMNYVVMDAAYFASRSSSAFIEFGEGLRKATGARLNTGEIVEFAKGIGFLAVESGKAAGPVSGFLDSIDREVQSPITNLIKDMEWVAAGGGAINTAFDTLKTAADQKLLPPEQIAAIAGRLLTITTDFQLELDTIDPQTARENLEEGLGAAMAKVAMQDIKGTEGLAGALADVTGIQYYLDFVVRVDSSALKTLPSSGGVTINPKWNDRDPDAGGAHGLSMVVPGGFPNDSFMIGATSGETVNIGGGSSGAPVGGTNISIAIYPTPGMDEATVGNIVAQKLSIAFRNMRAGGYARGA